MMKPWLVVSGVGEEGKQEGEQHSGLNDFLAVQRDVKDRPMRDGVASKLMSYILDGVKGKNGDVGGGVRIKREGCGDCRDGAIRGMGMGGDAGRSQETG